MITIDEPVTEILVGVHLIALSLAHKSAWSTNSFVIHLKMSLHLGQVAFRPGLACKP